jgi:phosphorylated adapter RNA export protein
MEGEDSILDSIYDDNFEDGEDVEMVDVEEGELVEHESQNGSVQGSSGNVSGVNQERGANQGRQSNKKRRRKKNKGNNSGPLTNVFDIDRLCAAQLQMKVITCIEKDFGALLWFVIFF